MRLAYHRPSLSLLFPIFHANPKRSISNFSVSLLPTSPKPQIPLFLRPPTYSSTISELRKWRKWAKTLASSVGSKFSESDNGPDSTLLLRELNWLVEDAVETHHLLSSHGEDDVEVKLRLKLEDLYNLWKQRIEDRRPFQYIVGCEHWRDLVLSVEDGVLIPRPETELIVDLVGDAIRENEELKEGLWADLGTGSGAIAIGIGRILRSCGRVVATDLSPVAVAVASYNIQRYNLQDKIGMKLGSWFEPLKDVEGELAGLVSNPPYIPSEDISGLQAEVGKHEPILALDGGASGMDDLLHLCRGAASMLKPGGFFAFETNGEKQCRILVDYMQSETKGSFRDLEIVSDLAGKQRFVTGFRSR
ncbi:peptide chain release factor N5-glutamine methyltransferase [Bertholletia excelsa]